MQRFVIGLEEGFRGNHVESIEKQQAQEDRLATTTAFAQATGIKSRKGWAGDLKTDRRDAVDFQLSAYHMAL